MDTIRSMSATFIDQDDYMTRTTYEGEQAWAALIAFKAPYKGVPKMPPLIDTRRKSRKKPAYQGVPKLTQLPSGKWSYKTKNGVGGRKAMFTQSKEYKLKDWRGCAMPWYGWKP